MQLRQIDKREWRRRGLALRGSSETVQRKGEAVKTFAATLDALDRIGSSGLEDEELGRAVVDAVSSVSDETDLFALERGHSGRPDRGLILEDCRQIHFTRHFLMQFTPHN